MILMYVQQVPIKLSRQSVSNTVCDVNEDVGNNADGVKRREMQLIDKNRNG